MRTVDHIGLVYFDLLAREVDEPGLTTRDFLLGPGGDRLVFTSATSSCWRPAGGRRPWPSTSWPWRSTCRWPGAPPVTSSSVCTRHLWDGPATNAERQRWLGQLDAGASRRVVAAGVFLGRERVGVDVASTCSRILRREPDATGRRYWLRRIRAGDGVADMEAAFTASAEYGLSLPYPPPD